MTKFEPFFNNAGALLNINDGNPLRQNENKCCHKIVILVTVVYDAAPCK